MNYFPIQNFDIKNIDKSMNVTIIGKRQAGKSTLIKDIMYNNRTIPAVVVISPCEEFSNFYSEFVSETNIHTSYDSEILANVFKRQQNMMHHKKESDGRVIVVMDDCMSSNFLNDSNLSELLLNGRHYNTLSILTLQFPVGVSPEKRCNMDYIFLFADDVISTRKRLYDHYAGMFPTFEIFQQIFSEITADHGCMVIKNCHAYGENIENIIFRYKAKPIPEFHIGTP